MQKLCVPWFNTPIPSTKSQTDRVFNTHFSIAWTAAAPSVNKTCDLGFLSAVINSTSDEIIRRAIELFKMEKFFDLTK